MPSENDTELTGNELALNDDSLNAIRNYFNNVLDTTQQWIDYAQANASDPAVTQEAALVVRQNIEDMKGQIALTTNLLGQAVRVIGGQQEAITELTDQRDEAVTEANTIRAEMEERETQAYENGWAEAIDNYEPDPYWIEDIVNEEVLERESQLSDEITCVAARLRQRGEAHDADELEAALGLSNEMKERAEELLSRAQKILWNSPLPVEESDDDDDLDDAEDDAA